jgi:hypothetical protein
MDRRSGRLQFLAAAVLLAGAMLAAGGCHGIATTAGHPVQGSNMAPDFAGLENKKVVVVCRPLVGLQYRDAGAPRDLALQVGRLLAKNDPKIKVVDQQEVSAWTDEHAWNEFPEVGRVLRADMVVGIDLTAFNLVEGTALYRGRATLDVKVFDLSQEKGREVVFEKFFPQVAYPPNISIPFSDCPEPEFRHRFVLVLADEVARHFYAYHEYADVRMDSHFRPEPRP